MIQIFPELVVTIYSRVAFDTEERAKEMVNYLLAHPRFAPDRAGEYEPLRRLTPARFEQAVASLVNRAGQERNPERVFSDHIFARKRRPSCSFSVQWARLPHVAFRLSSYSVEDKFIQKAEHLNEWLSFAVGLLDRHEAWYASYALHEESQRKNFLEWFFLRRQVGDQKIAGKRGSGVGVELERGIPGVYWGNYFGAFYVGWFGREKFKELPCVEKRWLENGGIFFTTAPTPFDWNTPAARQIQQAVKEHLGEDAFYDFEIVRSSVLELEPIPDRMRPEQFQTPRRVPDFPFKVSPPHSQTKPIEEQLAYARQAFESQGYTLIEEDGCTLLLRDESGGILRVTVGEGGSIEFLPPQ